MAGNEDADELIFLSELNQGLPAFCIYFCE